MKKSTILFFVLILCFFANLLSAQTIRIQNAEQRSSVGSKISFYHDRSKELEINEVAKIEFTDSEVEVPNFGVAKGNIWIRFTVTNKTEKNDLFLEIGQPTLDEVVFFDIQDNRREIQGDKFKFDQRGHNFTHFCFDLKIEPSETKTFFLKINSSNQIQVPLFIGGYDSIQTANQRLNLILSLFLGVMLAMLFYNAFLYFFVRDSSYLYYVLYITVLTLTQLTPHGFGFQYFWPNSPWMSQYSMFIFPIAVGITGILFFNSFLRTKKYFPSLLGIFKVLIFLYGVSVVLIFAGELKFAYSLIDMTALAVAVIMIFGAITIYRRGNRTALYFLVAWIVFLLGIVMWVLKDHNLLPFNNFTNYMMLLGAGIETILLSIGLADRINAYRRENEQSKLNEITALRENERLISEQNIMLEEKVQQRTLALEKLNNELQEALESVMKTQNKLVESEKMASLGQLTAGVAHEINNPINFVSSNIEPLKRDLQDLEALLELYAELDSNNISEKLKEIEAFKKEIELPYLRDELNEIILNIEEGARRTSEIVKSLKTFSRNDQKSKIPAQLNQGIESSLTLLNNKVENIKLNLNLKELPEILCYPGKLNQVFMNVLVNSIDAINSKFKGENGGEIRVDSHYDKTTNEVIVKFQDNGVGIPKETISKIYDPFFTTKEVGKGTGLGLSIVYQIIESHDGEIILNSTPGEGTSFTIKIPAY